MSPAERRERQLAEIRAAGAARAKASPPLTERQIERLAFVLAPHVGAPRRTNATLPQAA